jgi:hypothetical protein
MGQPECNYPCTCSILADPVRTAVEKTGTGSLADYFFRGRPLLK